MKPVTLIRGDADFLAERALARIRDELSDFPLEEIDARESLALTYALETPSLFDQGRLIVVRNADQVPAQALEAIARWAGSGPSGTHLVLMATGGAKAAKALQGLADVVEVRSPPPWETAKWVVEWTKGQGRKIAPDAAEVLVETLGRDLRELAGAVDQLGLAHEGTIDVAAVRRQFVGLESQVWTFVDSVMERNATAAMRHLRALLAAGENPIGILTMLARQLRAIAVVRGSERRPASAFAKELGMSEGAIKRAFRQARSFDDADVRRAFRLLADADLALKGGEQGESGPPEIVLEMLVAEVCGERARAR